MKQRKLTVKEGDVLDFISISWQAEHWEFDHPALVLEPLYRYSPNGETNEAMIEELAIDLSMEEQEDEQDIENILSPHGWKLSSIESAAKKRLKEIEAWESKGAEVLRQKIRFYNDEDNDLTFEVLEEQEF